MLVKWEPLRKAPDTDDTTVCLMTVKISLSTNILLVISSQFLIESKIEFS